MLKQLYYIVPAMFCCYLNTTAQQTVRDTASRESLNEVVVTATRTPRSVSNLPVPVTVIGQSAIERIGALRLNEVLMEQVGLQVITDHGTGLQLQGLSADYILILIDGEPVIGRTACTLDLTRLAVGNIQRIEIVKGPSSLLYGSEAMGGVVNIITKKMPAVLTDAKLQIISYYKGNPNTTTADFADLIKRPLSGYYSIRYMIQADGRRKLM